LHEDTCRRQQVGHDSLGADVGKVAYLDIETSDIGGNFNVVFCWAIKPRGEQCIFSALIAEPSLEAESKILRKLLQELVRYRTIITYFGTHFDLVHLRSRCAFHRLPFPSGELCHVDLCDYVHQKMKLRSSLRVVATLLGIEVRTSYEEAIWTAASRGELEALKYILVHNHEDVRILEQVHAKLAHI
jgi:uncharacterized protein YprB with RNaseH-like and TPR domain